MMIMSWTLIIKAEADESELQLNKLYRAPQTSEESEDSEQFVQREATKQRPPLYYCTIHQRID